MEEALCVDYVERLRPHGLDRPELDASLFSATLCCSLNNLSDSRWPPKSLRRRERHANRGLKSWVQKQAQKAPQAAVSPPTLANKLLILSLSTITTCVVYFYHNA